RVIVLLINIFEGYIRGKAIGELIFFFNKKAHESCNHLPLKIKIFVVFMATYWTSIFFIALWGDYNKKFLYLKIYDCHGMTLLLYLIFCQKKIEGVYASPLLRYL
ncbi:hypothetical protein ACJX0J_034414, partial [Zea mays]